MVGMIILSDEDASLFRVTQLASGRAGTQTRTRGVSSPVHLVVLLQWGALQLLPSQRQEFLNEHGPPSWSPAYGSQGEAAGDGPAVETFTTATVWPWGALPRAGSLPAFHPQCSEGRAVKSQGLAGNP